MNCFVLSQADELLVVDCGAAFPEDDLGADLVVPDFSYLLERQSRIAGIFITHGHEDHIGALPFLVRQFDRSVPIYAPPHAAALIAERFARHHLGDECLFVVEPRLRYDVGSFVVEPIAVAHSIIDATALSIDTKVGRVIHTGDFDLDEAQPAGHLTDESRFRALGDEGVRLLLSDSTNVETERREFHEGEVADFLAEAVAHASARVVVGMFSSNAHRMSALLRAAERTDRRVCLLGRSLERQFEVARALGVVSPKSSLLVSRERVGELDPEKVLVLAGGSQGEGPSSLRRLAQGTHPSLRLSSGDQVLLSARVIPGNERAVHGMINDFLRQGVDVVTRKDAPPVHTSGHASRTELSRMMSWVRPEAFVPVHGTLRHLRAHARLAQEMGVSNCVVVENGEKVVVRAGRALETVRTRHAGQVVIARGGEILSPQTRRRRGELARSGALFVSVSLDSVGDLTHRPEISAQGIPSVDEDEGASSVLFNVIRSTLLTSRAKHSLDLKGLLRQELKTAVYQMSGVRPLVVVHLTRK